MKFRHRGYVLKRGKIIGFNLFALKKYNYYLLSLLKQLPHLSLIHNELSELSVLKELKQLTQIDLADNKLSDISVLKKLKQLDFLDSIGNINKMVFTKPESIDDSFFEKPFPEN